MADVEASIGLPVDDDDVVSAARNVAKLTTEMRQLGGQMRQADSIRMHSLRRETDSVRTASAGAGANLGMLKSISPLSFGLITGGAAGAAVAVMGLVSKVADLGAYLVSAGVKGAVAFAKFAVATGQFRENTLTTLGILLKSKTVAQDVFDEAAQFASVTPFTTEQVVGGYKDLISKGFKPDELKRTFSAIGDLAAANPGDASIMGRITQAMGKIKAGGKMSAAELNQLSDAGLSQQTVMSEVAKIMGTSVEEARKAMSTGKVGSDVAIEAIVKAIEGDFGGTMAALSKTLTGLWSTLVSKPAELITKALDPRTTGEFAGGIMGFYDSIKSVVGDLGGMFFESDGKSLTKTGQEVVTTINAVGKAMTEAVSVGKAFFEGLFAGLSKNKDGTTNLRDALGNLNLEAMREEAFKFGEDVSKIAEAAASLTTVFTKLGESKGVIAVVGAMFSTIAFSIEATIKVIDVLINNLRLVGTIITSLGGGAFGNLISWVADLIGGPATGAKDGGKPSATMALERPFGMTMPGPTLPDGKTLPTIAPSVSSPIPAGPAAPTGDTTTNHNSVSVSVQGGMFPDEIAKLVRTEVQRAMDAL